MRAPVQFVGGRGTATYLFIVLLAVHGPALAVTNRYFDMGGVGTVLKTGYVRVTKDSAYDKQQGYGWIVAPEKEVIHSSDPTADELTRDGVVASPLMEFRADVASGRYFAEVTIGGSTQRDAEARVYVNGTLTAKSGRFVNAHTGRPRRTLRFPLEVKGDTVIVSVSSDAGPVELNGLAFKVPPYTPLRVEEGTLVADTPPMIAAYDRAKKLFDAGQYKMAARQFQDIPDTTLRAFCLLAVGGRLDAENAKMSVREAARMFAGYAGSDDPRMVNRFELVQKYLLAMYYYDLGAWSYADEQTGMSIWERFPIAADLMAQIAADPRDPLYHQALWYLGRIWYWMWREQHGGYQRWEADQLFNLLADYYPDYDLLAMYRGKKIAHPSDYSEAAEGAPLWAAAQREALGRLLEVIDYWAGVQNQNGELGGGYDDDCEILRWWPVAVFAADDERARTAIRRLADGIWESDVIEKGYAATASDVEHSAEPTSDTQPIMVGIDYGNPFYIERCMETMKCMRDVWTGRSARGHLHFKSAWLSATRCIEKQPFAVDVPMNARAAKPGRWLCWYNNNPTVTGLFSEWAKSWVEDAERIGKGKPEGVVPAAVAFPSDEIGGYADNWYHPNLYWDYYNWESGATHELCDQLLATYDLTGNTRLLYPVEKGLEMAQSYWANPVQDAKEGSRDWAAQVLHNTGIANYGGALGTLTRTTRFDDYLKEHGTAYTRFLLTGDKSHLLAALEDSINSTQYNFPLLTDEVKFTDRVAVRGADELLAMYTGAHMRGPEYASYAVTWSGTTRDFAALVLKATSNFMKVLVYSFEPAERTVRLRLWKLEPGTYRVRVGADRDGDGGFDLDASEQIVTIDERGTAIDAKLAGRRQLLIEITQTEKGTSRPRHLADLALTEADVIVQPAEPRAGEEAALRVTIHNIGSAPAQNVAVALIENNKRIDDQVLDSMAAPNDLERKIGTATLTWNPNIPRTYRFTVTLDPEDTIKEITEVNNSIDIEVRVAQ